MRITEVRVIVTCPTRNYVVVKILTDEPGLYGVETATLNGRELAVAAALTEHIAPLLIGRDPDRIEDIWQMLFRGRVLARRACPDDRAGGHRHGPSGTSRQARRTARIQPARRQNPRRSLGLHPRGRARCRRDRRQRTQGDGTGLQSGARPGRHCGQRRHIRRRGREEAASARWTAAPAMPQPAAPPNRGMRLTRPRRKHRWREEGRGKREKKIPPFLLATADRCRTSKPGSLRRI